ncbi:MAG TPA: GDP-mannose 4,6-dehydratase [Candidatus Limnocylindria bacterium]|nr:GDP-mannose 4,6-dehydratase [Candidatus Limnocylindria bacterium]
MPRSVLITGITGFAGSHLTERFVRDGVLVHGIAHEDPPYRNLASVADRVRIHRGNVLDADTLRSAVAAARPEAVVHLAAQAVPTLAARDPVGAVRVNVLGTATLLAVLDEYPDVRLVMASSADVYGAPDAPLVDERAPLRPANVYAATKVASEALVREFGDRRRAATTVLRPANQIGPRQHPGLAASAFAKQIAEAEAGVAEPVVKHGLLDARRDFLDVRDMAAAYSLAADLSHAGAAVYNVGAGEAVSVSEILDTLIGLARVPMRAELDPERVRTGTSSDFALDAARFRGATGWEPRIAIRTSLTDTLEYWRAETRAAVRA